MSGLREALEQLGKAPNPTCVACGVVWSAHIADHSFAPAEPECKPCAALDGGEGGA